MLSKMNKQQVILVRWWVAKENYKDFEDYLNQYQYNPYETKTNRRHRHLSQDLWDSYEILEIPMPNRHFADYTYREIMFQKVFPYITKNPIFIGHSLWATFLFKYFNQKNIQINIRWLFLISTAYTDSNLEKLWTFNFDKNLLNIDQIK